MQQVTAASADKVRIERTGSHHGHSTDQRRITELVRAREHNRGGVGAQFKCVLERCFDRREGASYFFLNSLGCFWFFFPCR